MIFDCTFIVKLDTGDSQGLQYGVYRIRREEGGGGEDGYTLSPPKFNLLLKKNEEEKKKHGFSGGGGGAGEGEREEEGGGEEEEEGANPNPKLVWGLGGGRYAVLFGRFGFFLAPNQKYKLTLNVLCCFQRFCDPHLVL